MTTYEQALKKAKKLKPSVDSCTEYTDAFMFSQQNDVGFGGNGPVVIMKESGKALNMADYLDSGEGEVVKEAAPL